MRKLFTLAMSTGLFAFSLLANAQDIDEITVVARPIQASQMASIEAKRTADNVAEAISSDVIGRFPDQNLADSLGRVPGLAIERDQGQARFVNFRGAPFRYTAIAFDGIDVLGAENGRIPRFDSFPSVITSSVLINKAITSDMPGEAVSGFININTFDPFEFDGARIALEAGLGNQELGDLDIDKYNARLSYSNDTFGVVGFYSHNKRGRITDNRELELEETPEGIIPNNLDFRSYRGYREDNAYGASVESRPDDDTRFFLSTLYSEFIDYEERNQWDFDIADGADISGATLTPTTGYQPVVLVQRLLEAGFYNNSTFSNTLGADFGAGDWEIELRLNYTETENLTDLPIPYSLGATIAASYDITDVDAPILLPFETSTQTPTNVNLLEYPRNFGLFFASELNTDAIKLKADAARDITLFDTPTRVKMGVQYDTREAEGGDALLFGGFPGSVNIGDFVTDKLWDTGFNNSVQGLDHDNAGLRAAWEQANGGSLTVDYDPDSLIGIDEDIFAVYAMATSEYSWGSFVYGLRIEMTDYTSTGTLLDENGDPSPIVQEDDYVDFLPSAHLNVDLSEDVKLRLSASSGVSRPTYSEMRASATVDVITFEVSGGNPLIEPESAWGFDGSLEWYFAPAAIASVGAFYRDVDNVIYADSVIIPDGSTYAPGLIEPGTPTTFNSFFNGEDGKLVGVEANLISSFPAPFDTFGFSGNITVLESEFAAPTLGIKSSLPGTSDLIYNASIWFEDFGVSARVNYQYRDDWLSTTENEGLSEFWAEEERLDASVRYVLPLGNNWGGVLTLFANANNLTDFVDVRYSDSRRTPNQVEGFGARYLIGFRLDY